MFGHTCNHPNGKSHLCGCRLKESHGAYQINCGLHGGTGAVTRDEKVTSVYVGEVHNFEGSAVTGACGHCGEILQHRLHPHKYLEASDFRRVCVCGATSRALIHQMTQI